MAGVKQKKLYFGHFYASSLLPRKSKELLLCPSLSAAARRPLRFDLAILKNRNGGKEIE